MDFKYVAFCEAFFKLYNVALVAVLDEYTTQPLVLANVTLVRLEQPLNA